MATVQILMVLFNPEMIVTCQCGNSYTQLLTKFGRQSLHVSHTQCEKITPSSYGDVSHPIRSSGS